MIPLSSQANAVRLQTLGIDDWLDRAHGGKIKTTPERIATKEARLSELRAAVQTFAWLEKNEAAVRAFIEANRSAC